MFFSLLLLNLLSFAWHDNRVWWLLKIRIGFQSFFVVFIFIATNVEQQHRNIENWIATVNFLCSSINTPIYQPACHAQASFPKTCPLYSKETKEKKFISCCPIKRQGRNFHLVSSLKKNRDRKEGGVLVIVIHNSFNDGPHSRDSKKS